jgi:hypothetical protein
MEVGMRTQRNGAAGQRGPAEAGPTVRRGVTRSWPVLVVAAALLLSTHLQGHHSFADYYIEADTIEIEGEVVEFQYKNPHSWIHVQGQDAFGAQKIYAAEWSSVSRLDRDGITKDFFKVGDRVRIWASPSRNPNDNRVRLKRIERRRDHWKWGGNRIDTR